METVSVAVFAQREPSKADDYRSRPNAPPVADFLAIFVDRHRRDSTRPTDAKESPSQMTRLGILIIASF